MGHEMTGHKMMGHAMTGPGMMEQGMHALPGGADRVVPIRHLTVDDVRHFLEHRLARGDNRRLAVGSVEAADDERIIAEITTADGSLVERLEVDRHTGEMRSIE